MHSEKEWKRRKNETRRISLEGEPTLEKREKENSDEGLYGSLRDSNKQTLPEHSSSQVSGVIVLALLGIERNYYNS